jgi:hypothetical protein
VIPCEYKPIRLICFPVSVSLVFGDSCEALDDLPAGGFHQRQRATQFPGSAFHGFFKRTEVVFFKVLKPLMIDRFFYRMGKVFRLEGM